jgi:uncharacterized cupredoxin-like copper-binding protein
LGALRKEKAMNKNFLVLLVLVLVLALSACAKSGPSTKISFTMTDFAFNPNEFTIPAGKDVTLTVTHNGTMEHSFIVMKHGTGAGEVFDEADKTNVYWEVDLQPGESETVLFAAPEIPGTYQVICGMPGHLQSGMIGKLIVTAEQ